MKRTNYFVPTELHSRLKDYSIQSGVPMSEVMRRALEQYLKDITNGVQCKIDK